MWVGAHDTCTCTLPALWCFQGTSKYGAADCTRPQCCLLCVRSLSCRAGGTTERVERPRRGLRSLSRAHILLFGHQLYYGSLYARTGWCSGQSSAGEHLVLWSPLWQRCHAPECAYALLPRRLQIMQHVCVVYAPIVASRSSHEQRPSMCQQHQHPWMTPCRVLLAGRPRLSNQMHHQSLQCSSQSSTASSSRALSGRSTGACQPDVHYRYRYPHTAADALLRDTQ